jgi:DNA-binding GntR family transcriptional regulator
MGSIRSRLRWSLVQHDDLEHIADEHVALYEAVRDRDGDRASALALAHVESSRRERLAHAVSQRQGGVRAPAS